jgi:uncharacterized protein YqgV (UPF0045/DUF77 family)
MKQLEPADTQLQNEMQTIVAKIRNGEEILLEEESKQPSTFIRF